MGFPIIVRLSVASTGGAYPVMVINLLKKNSRLGAFPPRTTVLQASYLPYVGAYYNSKNTFTMLYPAKRGFPVHKVTFSAHYGELFPGLSHRC